MLRKSLCCRAQPLNSVIFREPHTYFKDLLFALESSSEIPSLHPLNSNMHCWDLPGCLFPAEKAGLGHCMKLCGFGGGGGRGQSETMWPAQSAQSVIDSGSLWFPECSGSAGQEEKAV